MGAKRSRGECKGARCVLVQQHLLYSRSENMAHLKVHLFHEGGHGERLPI